MDSENGPSCWFNRTKNERKLILGVIILGVALMLFLLIFLLLFQGPDECTTSTCAQTSLELLKHYIDINVDPCEDFYHFSCGNFLKNAELDYRGLRSTKSILDEDINLQIKNLLAEPEQSTQSPDFNLARKFYRACMNESAIEADGLKKLKQIFQQIGGWPTLNGNNWRESAFDWKDAVGKLRRMGINVDFFLIHSVQRNKSDPNKYILNLEDPGYSPTGLSSEIKMYLEYMVDVAVLIGAQKQRAQKEQTQVLHFMLQLANISEEIDAANESRFYNELSLSELKYIFPQVPWFEYLNSIVAPDAEITHDDVVAISNVKYLKKMLNILESTDKRIVANVLCWHIVQNLVYFLPPNIYNRTLELFRAIQPHRIVESRSNLCVHETEKRFPFVIPAAYMEKYLGEETRHRILSMIRNIKYQFEKNLYKLDWLDEETKNIVFEKLVTSVENIPSYDNLIKAGNVYEGVEVFEDKLLTSVLNLDYLAANIQYRKLQHPETETIWAKTGITGSNIVYSPTENSLNIPVGLFRGVFYLKDRPEYMNYGALGSVIAHEIYHVITEAEAEAGLQGDSRSRWSSHSLLNYEDKLKCISDQYGTFVVKEIQQHLNASNTRHEDMADLAGIKVAYDTYRNWVGVNGIEPRLSGLNYSPNQLFWISSAIHHCSKYSPQVLQRYVANYRKSPAEFRVNGPLQNLDEFALDFGCPKKTNMNPQNKCRIW